MNTFLFPKYSPSLKRANGNRMRIKSGCKCVFSNMLQSQRNPHYKYKKINPLILALCPLLTASHFFKTGISLPSL